MQGWVDLEYNREESSETRLTWFRDFSPWSLAAEHGVTLHGMTWPRIALVLAGVGFLGFGLAYTLWPLPMGRVTDIPLPTPDARIDFAATYGGLQMALGVFFLVSSRRPGWREPALWAAAAAFLGFLIVRLHGTLVSQGRPTRVILVAFAIELVGLLISLHALRSLRAGGPDPSPTSPP